MSGFSELYKRYALGMLTFACMLNGIDRGLMALLAAGQAT